MKIYDCFTYLNEDLILNLRFNILDKYVDYFIVIEGNITHSGERKKKILI
jgi:beta-1,4-mannosyl-glycoprotein beta-1,4-N-acetylglucosaminyltransferase